MSTPSCILGLDLGTSSLKVVLLDAGGAVVAAATAAYPTATPAPGWAEQDPAHWLHALADAIPTVAAAAPGGLAAIAGIALTSAAHIGVLLDAGGEPVRPAILWHDQRSSAEVAELEAAAGGDILDATFQAVSTGWTLPHLCWIRRHDPAAWARTRRVCLSKDYLMARLTGQAPVTDPATAVSAQLYDVRSQAWSPDLCALAGIGPGMLPDIRPATAIVGGLDAAMAARLGLVAGLPVVNGTLDSATEMLAAGLDRPGDALVRLATAGGVQLVVAAPRPSRRCITYPCALPPCWYCQAGTSTCAAAVQWAVATFGFPGMGFAEWDALAAAAPPGADDLLFHPYLAGERAPHWDPHLRASFVGLSLHHQRGHLARAVYEGVACSLRQAIAVLPSPPRSDAPLAVLGGGSRSRLWRQILADVLDRPLRLAAAADSATGAALLGQRALGLAQRLEAVALDGTLITPDPAHRHAYDRIYGRYVALHRRLAPHYAAP